MQLTGDLAADIERLAAEYRHRPSREYALQLLELRYRRGREMLAQQGDNSYPIRSAPDLFDHGRGISETWGKALSGELLASALLNYGALLVRGLFSPEQVQHLLAHSEENSTASPHGPIPLGCSAQVLQVLLEVYRECGLLRTVREYLGNEAVLFAERAKLRHHRGDRDRYAVIPWHQDVNFFGDQCYALNCWAAITPCGEDNPGLAVVPRRTELRHGWDSEELAPLDYGKCLSEGEIEALSRDFPVVTPVFEPGDAILFDEMTIHTTRPKPWKRPDQIVAISWFFRAAHFPRWGTPLAL